MAGKVAETLRLKVAEARSRDVGRGVARMDPSDMARLGVRTGEVVAISGKRRTVARAIPAYREERGQGRVHVDGVIRLNAAARIDEAVQLEPSESQPAERVELTPVSAWPRSSDVEYLGNLLAGVPVVQGDRVRAILFGSRPADFEVGAVRPAGAVVIGRDTQLEIGRPREDDREQAVTYEDIGGLSRQIQRIREIVELPLRAPEVFGRLGIDPPKGVLLLGPPGCGKTLIARAIAHETAATFLSINGPEIIHKFYGESEANLRSVFSKAEAQSPSIIFIDEIDAIAPRRESTVGEVEKRVVAQLLSLMDGLRRRRDIVVLAATNIPNVLDPALRRPGRFDREVSIPIPDRAGRREVLEIHSRGMPLRQDVDLDELAGGTHGFVGADLAALCREAAMVCVRRIMPQIDFSRDAIPLEVLDQLEVGMDDFDSALREVEPSALREVFVETPDVAWDEVGGLEQVKRRLMEAVQWPLQYPRFFSQADVTPARGILLHGPPGCGKTLLAKAVASESKVNFIAVKGPQQFSKYVGESERAVREAFHRARQASPCILFFDEIDALLATRNESAGDSRVGQRVLSQFLSEFDGVEELAGVLVLGATNRRDLIDPAVLRPGRFDLLLEVGLPDAAARRQIFQIALRDKPIDGQLDWDELVGRSEGMSGADIQAICREAGWAAIRDAVERTRQGQSAEQVEVRVRAEAVRQAIDRYMTHEP